MLTKVLHLAKFLRLRPFDADTAQGREQERYRRAAWSILTQVAARVMAIATMAASVAWTLPYMGNERFGAWMALASLAGVLTFLDMGMGNALTTRVAEAAAKDDPGKLAEVITGGLSVLLCGALAVALILFLLSGFVPWESLIKTSAATHEEVRQGGQVFALLFGVFLFSTGVQKVYAGLQQAYKAHMVLTLGSALSLLGLYVTLPLQPGVPLLLILSFGLPSSLALCLLWPLWRMGLVDGARLIGHIQSQWAGIMHVGGLYLLLQIGGAIGWGLDNLFISSFLDASQVAPYAVTQRLFQLVAVPLAIMNAPLWAMYTEALSRGDHAFVQKTLVRSLRWTFLLSLAGGAVLFSAATPIIRVWTSGHVEVSTGLVLSFWAWTVLEATGSALAMYLNGAGVVREQVVTVLVLIALALPLKLWALAQAGVTAMVLAYALVYALVVGFMYGVAYRKRLFGRWDAR